MRRLASAVVLLAVAGWLVAGAVNVGVVAAAPDDGVVRAILFYSPTCGHCHEVMTNVLPPLRDRYGDALTVAEVDTTTPAGGALFQAMLVRYAPDVRGVPTLIVGDQLMVGAVEIPEQFPGHIDAYLAEGGVAWPELPGVEAAIGAEAMAGAVDPEPSPPQSFWETVRDRYTRDLTGNILSTVVLLGLVATIVAVAVPRAWQPRVSARFGSAAVYVLIVVGLVAAGYLAYIETTGSEAVCGPVGDCNAVQQSEYALILGFLPMAVLGVLGYLGILSAYVTGQAAQEPLAAYARAAAFAMAAFGLLFSTYLTFLEPFVIGATCAWCLTSAVCMALLTLLVTGPGWQALGSLERE